jgi:hypothetical protein
MTTLTEELEAVKCHHNNARGMLISSPPQYLCEYCGNKWIYGTQTPVCPVLKEAAIATLRGLQMPEKLKESNKNYSAGEIKVFNRAIAQCKLIIELKADELEAV